MIHINGYMFKINEIRQVTKDFSKCNHNAVHLESMPIFNLEDDIFQLISYAFKSNLCKQFELDNPEITLTKELLESFKRIEGDFIITKKEFFLSINNNRAYYTKITNLSFNTPNTFLVYFRNLENREISREVTKDTYLELLKKVTNEN